MASQVHIRKTWAVPPAPPNGRLAASIQRMPPAWRWTLGLVLAFLSSVAFMLLSDIHPFTYAIALVVTFALALAAGFVLSSWWAWLALAVASAAGGFAGSWLLVQLAPAGTVAGLTGIGATLVAFGFFAILRLGPFILFLLSGIGLGRLQGMALGHPEALSATEARVSQWIAALAAVIAGGFLTQHLGNMPGLIAMQAEPGDVVGVLPGILYAAVLAVTCLLAGWVLRSWWAVLVAPIVYAGVSVLESLAFGGLGDWSIWTTAGFGLYIVLPALVMSAIGAAIGRYRAG